MKPSNGTMHITKREKDVLIRCWKSDANIARDLVLGISTIKTHLWHLFNKFNSSNRAELLFKALKSKAITLEEVDCGFWKNEGNYKEDYQIIDFSKDS